MTDTLQRARELNHNDRVELVWFYDNVFENAYDDDGARRDIAARLHRLGLLSRCVVHSRPLYSINDRGRAVAQCFVHAPGMLHWGEERREHVSRWSMRVPREWPALADWGPSEWALAGIYSVCAFAVVVLLGCWSTTLL